MGGGMAPKGYSQGADGLDNPEQEPTVWQLGSSVEVAWAISANHGGGYSYRLCKKSDGVSEECFQRTPLRFSGETSHIIDSQGTFINSFPMTKVTEGTTPAGSEWARDPVPGCNMCEDAIAACGQPLDPVSMNETGGGYSGAWDQQVNCYGSCCGAASSKVSGVCPAEQNSTLLSAVIQDLAKMSQTGASWTEFLSLTISKKATICSVGDGTVRSPLRYGRIVRTFTSLAMGL